MEGRVKRGVGWTFTVKYLISTLLMYYLFSCVLTILTSSYKIYPYLVLEKGYFLLINISFTITIHSSFVGGFSFSHFLVIAFLLATNNNLEKVLVLSIKICWPCMFPKYIVPKLMISLKTLY